VYTIFINRVNWFTKVIEISLKQIKTIKKAEKS